MTGNHGLAFSVNEAGIFLHFIASDGSETQIDALTVLDCSSAMTAAHPESLFLCHQSRWFRWPCRQAPIELRCVVLRTFEPT